MTEQKPDQELYDELSLYTLELRDPEFIHQYIVDAYAAQHAGEHTKVIALTFALVGLYLHIEKNYSGKEVQNAHVKMAKKINSAKKEWPRFTLHAERGSVTVVDVLRATPGAERDEMINTWSESVWSAYSDSHAEVARLAHDELGT